MCVQTYIKVTAVTQAVYHQPPIPHLIKPALSSTPPLPRIAAHVIGYCENGQTGGRTTHTIENETNKKMLDTFKATVTMSQRRRLWFGTFKHVFLCLNVQPASEETREEHTRMLRS